MKLRPVVILLALPLLFAACGGGAHSLGPAPTQQQKVAPLSGSGPSAATVRLEVWFVRDGGLVRTNVQVPKTLRVATAAVRQLLAGPKKGFATAVPSGTRLLGISIRHGIATIDVTSQFQAGGGSRSLQLRLGQMVYTLTQFPTVAKVLFELDGSPVNVFSSKGIVLDHPVGRKDYKDLLPAPTVAGSWQSIPISPATPDFGSATGVWTGTKILAFGRDTITALDANGNPYAVETRAVAASYTPGGGWQKLTPPQPRNPAPERDTAVWTGSEMLVWGTNVAFDPASNSWRRLPAAPPGGGLVVWTGAEMIGWGGGCCGDASNDGAAYDPSTNTWRRLAAAPLAGSQHPIGAWTGKELIVVVGDGAAAAYDPGRDSWHPIARLPQSNVLTGGASAVWDGKELLVGGTSAANHRSSTGGFAFDPSANSWRRLPPARIGRTGAAAVWDGNAMLLWGGGPGGSSYSPAADEWSSLPPAPLPEKLEATAVWTGRSMIVWGGVPTSVWGKSTPAGAIFTPVS